MTTKLLSDKKVKFQLSGLSFEIVGLTDGLVQRLAPIYSGFNSSAPEENIVIEFNFKKLTEKFYVSDFMSSEIPETKIDTKNLYGIINFDISSGVINYSEDALDEFEFSFGALMAKIIAFWLAINNGNVLHCSGVVKGGKGYLFLAPSGGGKSTTADLVKSDYILNDDRLIVQKKDNLYKLSNTPIWDIPGLNHVSVPLEKLFFVVKSADCAIKPIGPDVALRSYLTSLYDDVYWQVLGGHLTLARFNESGVNRKVNIDFTFRMLDVLTDIFKNTPTYQLSVSLDRARVMEVLNDYL